MTNTSLSSFNNFGILTASSGEPTREHESGRVLYKAINTTEAAIRDCEIYTGIKLVKITESTCFDPVEEEIECAGAEDAAIYFNPKSPVAVGLIYSPSMHSTGKDWETGYDDGFEVIMNVTEILDTDANIKEEYK
jgi:hypothetical protein